VKIGVLSETVPGERRVALVPDVAAKLTGFEVSVQAGAGEAAGFADDAYREAGAAVESDRAALVAASDVLLSVQPPPLADVAKLRQGAATIGFLQPATQAAVVEALAARGVTAFSLELLPRISRAQSMDVLSSQASLAAMSTPL
jgi:NAD(P) transhydrogenase subunit alpha